MVRFLQCLNIERFISLFDLVGFFDINIVVIFIFLFILKIKLYNSFQMSKKKIKLNYVTELNIFPIDEPESELTACSSAPGVNFQSTVEGPQRYYWTRGFLQILD